MKHHRALAGCRPLPALHIKELHCLGYKSIVSQPSADFFVKKNLPNQVPAREAPITGPAALECGTRLSELGELVERPAYQPMGSGYSTPMVISPSQC
jgi:hypothetical protein